MARLLMAALLTRAAELLTHDDLDGDDVPGSSKWEATVAAYRRHLVKAATAELLASGRTLYVSSMSSGELSVVYAGDPRANAQEVWLPIEPALTPPGTVHQAVLLIPEATE